MELELCYFNKEDLLSIWVKNFLHPVKIGQHINNNYILCFKHFNNGSTISSIKPLCSEVTIKHQNISGHRKICRGSTPIRYYLLTFSAMLLFINLAIPIKLLMPWADFPLSTKKIVLPFLLTPISTQFYCLFCKKKFKILKPLRIGTQLMKILLKFGTNACNGNLLEIFMSNSNFFFMKLSSVCLKNLFMIYSYVSSILKVLLHTQEETKLWHFYKKDFIDHTWNETSF